MPDFVDPLNAALEGRYRVERELGAGGMATVYLAEDLRHHRKVALKVLKPELAAVVGAERFLSEIEVTAGLQHPHILPLFDSGEAGSFLFYVMPWVEGESLRDRLQHQRQLPVDEAIRIATAVANALDHAHRRGVIHRDIKPANILLQEGEPVVADFGIALAVGAAGGARLTETGLSLGTPYYMSPEQATGDQHVGPASDTYALACVLYEMLVGEPPYLGNTAQAVLGKIIAGAPVEPTTQRPSIPANVDAAIRKGLEKLPADRFTSAQAFVEALGDPNFRHGGEDRVGSGAASAGRWRRRAFALGLVAAVSTSVAIWALARPRTPAPVSRFVVGMDGDEALWYTGSRNPPRLSIADDGSRFVFTGWGSQRRPLLRVRALDQLGSVALGGTEGGLAPAISPSGDEVAFLGESPGGDASLAVVSLSGGTPIVLVASGVTAGPAWGGDESVYFIGPDGRTLMKVPDVGGPADTVVTFDLGSHYSRYLDPVMVSDEIALVTAVAQDDMTDVHFVDLTTGASTFAVAGSGGRVTPTGEFLYVTGSGGVQPRGVEEQSTGSLMAQRYPPGARAPIGRPTPVLDGVGLRRGGIVDLTLASNGTLLYVTENRDADERLTWVDANGGTELVDPRWTDHIEVEALALSPGGDQVAIDMATADRVDVWVKRLEEGAPRRLTFEGELNMRPAWSPDGLSIAYVSGQEGDLDAWVRPADGSGSPKLLLDHERSVFEIEWSPDGEWLLAVLEGSSYDIGAMRAGSPDSLELILAGDRDEWEPTLSPDGRWLAYVSDEETGRAEVFVVPFPDVASGKWQISSNGGREPRWSRDGSELFVRHEDGFGVDIFDMSRGPSAPRRRSFVDFSPDEYFETNEFNDLYDIGRDGRLLMIRAGQGDITGNLVIVQNFFQEMRDRTAR